MQRRQRAACGFGDSPRGGSSDAVRGDDFNGSVNKILSPQRSANSCHW
jgi:hypothetical protein